MIQSLGFSLSDSVQGVDKRKFTLLLLLLLLRPLVMPGEDLLDWLSDELIDQVGQHALARHLPSALRFGETCKGLRTKLEAVLSAAEARRLRWLPEPTTFHVIYDQGRSLTRPLHSVAACVDTHAPRPGPRGLRARSPRPHCAAPACCTTKGLGQLAPRLPASGAPYVPHLP